MKKRVMLCLSALLLVLGGCSQSSTETQPAAQPAASEAPAKSDFPNRPIEILVPFAAGGSTDTSARMVAKYLPKYLPKEVNIVIVNKPGAGGTIAATTLLNSKPDGYTLELATHRAIAMQPLHGNTTYQHDSFQPIAKVTTDQQVLAVSADAPYNTFEEWLQYVKDNPGKFNYGVSGGIGSGSHLPMAELEMLADFKGQAVAFDGTAPALTAVLGGQIDGAISQPSSVKGFVEDGKMKMIFNAGATPVPYAPEVPLLVDKGYDVIYDSNASILAPKGLPEDVLAILIESFKKTLEDPALIEELAKLNIQVDYKGPEEVQEELDRENEKSKKVLTSLGLLK